jgi:HSP20 family protein
MTDAPMHSNATVNADKPAGKRNDVANEAERRSFREPGEAAYSAGSQMARAAGGVFDEARRELERFAGSGGYWAPSLLMRQFDPLLRMQTDMLRWFDDMWLQTGAAFRPLQRMGAMTPSPVFGLPPSDVKETEAAYVLSVELPGMKREDIDLAMDGDALLISGHKQEQRQEAGAAYRLSERRFGRFERSFPLPPDVRREAVSAEFHDGVLAITLPRTGAPPAGKRERVQIKG